MPRYLLATQTLVDIAKRDNRAPSRWFDTAQSERGIHIDEIFISAVTPAIVALSLRKATPTPANEALRQTCERLIDRLVHAGRVVNVTKEIADLWGTLLDYELRYTTEAGESGRYTTSEKLVLATAIQGTEGRPYVLVSRRQPAHTDLRPIGLEIEDPYEMFP